LLLRPLHGCTRVPYTTLFRSREADVGAGGRAHTLLSLERLLGRRLRLPSRLAGLLLFVRELLALGLTLRSCLCTVFRVIHRLGGGCIVCRLRRGRVFAGQTLFFGLRVYGA